MSPRHNPNPIRSTPARLLLPWLALTLTAAPILPAAPLPANVHRVVALGDSITYSGQYLAFVEAWFVQSQPDRAIEFLNLGLPSETVSGLSEPGHAGGQFPRPSLLERLDRVLDQTRPDLVLACYGMNCGIYHPFSEERFKAFQTGMQTLHDKTLAAGAAILHLTPPVFDPIPIQARTLPGGLDVYPQPYAGYNDVLDRYASWLVGQRDQKWTVIDIHTPMNRFLEHRRELDPQFKLAGDGVHLNDEGHWLIAREILRHFGAPESATSAPNAPAMLASNPTLDPDQMLSLIRKKQRILSDAWLTRTGHLRPGMAKGLPLEDAQARARELDGQIRGGKER